MIDQEHSRTKYFRSFAGYMHPVVPKDEVSLRDAKRLATYYEAVFNTAGRLVKFIKHLRQTDTTGEQWIKAFSEVYVYWDNGSVKRRTFQVDGHPDQVWEFDKKRTRWTDYIDGFCHRWFGSAKKDAEPSLAEKSLLFHEQVTELEQSLLAACYTSKRDAHWARQTTTELVQSFRDVILQMDPYEAPLICAAGLGMEEVQFFQGFDDPPPNLFGILLEQLGDFKKLIVFPRIDFDDQAKAWAQQSELGAVLATPVMGSDGNNLIEVFTVFLLLQSEPNSEQVAVMNSLVRRFAILMQLIVSQAGIAEFYESRRDS